MRTPHTGEIAGKDSRRTRRYHCYGPIEIQIGGWRPYAGTISNLSLQGCLIKPARSFDCEVGDRIDLRLQVNRLSFRSHCIVRWIRPNGSLGVEILKIGLRGRQQLIELMQELEELDRGLHR